MQQYPVDVDSLLSLVVDIAIEAYRSAAMSVEIPLSYPHMCLTFGLLIYRASGGKYFSYPEERPGFEVPEKYRRSGEKGEKRASSPKKKEQQSSHNNDGTSEDAAPGREGPRRSSSQATRVEGEDVERGDDEPEAEDEKEDPNMVTWYGPDDPENPLNWRLLKKCWVTFCIMLITVTVYMGSSIYSPGVTGAVEYFGLGQVTVTLGLSLFVAGYGIGPLFLSPITEIPKVGRTIPYIVTLALFCILQIPTALVTNFAGFAILRFLAGFVGSPPLATGGTFEATQKTLLADSFMIGASLQDVFHPKKLPYAMGLYGLAASSGPALAPVVAGFAVQANGWRWSFWEMLMLSGFSLVLLFFTLPETSSTNILYRRAARLRKLTGNDELKSEGEIQSASMTPTAVLKGALLRPFVMTFTEPIVLAIDIYIGLIYAILYSYFESFPIVYEMGYGWNLGVSNLPFLAILVGSIISYAGYATWNRLYFEPLFDRKKGKVAPEARLPMSMLAAFCFPICLFWFAWTSNRTHWISPIIAASFFGIGATWMFMPFLTYLPHAYPKEAASVLASNDFFRSMMGAGMPLAAHGLFVNLGIDWGNTLLACLTVLFIPIPFLLYFFGANLRNRSPTALHDKDI
ncbi:MFS transporter, DHA1 family, multidrug resistance protein, partial [Tremellales sp. Uapishka_1]